MVNLDAILESTCMVCMATKPSLEKAGKNFSEHISDFHNIWKYLYFLIYLNSKNKENINGIEDIVYDQFINGKAEWINSKISRVVIFLIVVKIEMLEGSLKKNTTEKFKELSDLVKAHLASKPL